MKNQDVKPIESDICGVYRHYKGGMYRVVCLAHHSETLEDMVVYEPLDGKTGFWVRPASMWNETVEKDGKVFQRFTYIN